MAKEFEIYVPTNYNDGSKVEQEKLDDIGDRLLEFFGGVTYFPQENKGVWRVQGVTYRDNIVLYRVVTKRTRVARRFLSEFKEWLKQDLKQEDILIVERDVKTL
ncbi:MAG: hypothetical protein L0215_10645 [Gemmataceae bacterium]|nr:hypothetical protein [Gemmataceae bacterium]